MVIFHSKLLVYQRVNIFELQLFTDQVKQVVADLASGIKKKDKIHLLGYFFKYIADIYPRCY